MGAKELSKFYGRNQLFRHMGVEMHGQENWISISGYFQGREKPADGISNSPKAHLCPS